MGGDISFIPSDGETWDGYSPALSIRVSDFASLLHELRTTQSATALCAQEADLRFLFGRPAQGCQSEFAETMSQA